MKFVSLKKKIRSVTPDKIGQGYLHSIFWPVPNTNTFCLESLGLQRLLYVLYFFSFLQA